MHHLWKNLKGLVIPDREERTKRYYEMKKKLKVEHKDKLLKNHNFINAINKHEQLDEDHFRSLLILGISNVYDLNKNLSEQVLMNSLHSRVKIDGVISKEMLADEIDQRAKTKRTFTTKGLYNFVQGDTYGRTDTIDTTEF